MLGFKDWKEESVGFLNAPVLIRNRDQEVILPDHALALTKLIKKLQPWFL